MFLLQLRDYLIYLIHVRLVDLNVIYAVMTFILVLIYNLGNVDLVLIEMALPNNHPITWMHITMSGPALLGWLCYFLHDRDVAFMVKCCVGKCDIIFLPKWCISKLNIDAPVQTTLQNLMHVLGKYLCEYNNSENPQISDTKEMVHRFWILHVETDPRTVIGELHAARYSTKQ